MSYIFYKIIYLVIAVVSYLRWKKTNDKMFLKISLSGLGLVVLSIWDDIAINYLQFNDSGLSLNSRVVMILRTVVIVYVLFVIIQALLARRKM